MTRHYFTIEPTESGFTDQLMQFNAFYKLGLALGYDYLHTPFRSHRSSASDLPRTGVGRQVVVPDVHEFIGINHHFAARQALGPVDVGNPTATTIRLSDDVLVESNIGDFQSLVEHVRRLARQSADAGAIKFCLDGPRRRLFGLIQAELPAFPDGLSLPRIYSDARVRAPMESLHRETGLKILLHVRQGDTGVLATPWGTRMPVWSFRKDRLKEYEDFGQIPSAELLFDVPEYKRFLDGFLDRLRPSEKSLLVFSDGASRSFKIVESNLEKLAWSPEKIASFRQSRLDYDQRQFECFAGSEDIRLHVGEEPTKLFQLIHSAIESDVVIVSNQQRLVPKLVANLGGANSPKVVVLYKGAVPDNSDVIRNDRDRFIYVDIANPDFDAVIRRLRA
jgi:hypothetical protein